METVLGTYRDGQVVLERPVDWPNGATLEVRLGISAQPTNPRNRDDRCGDGSLPPSTPEEIDEWLRWFDSLEPFHWTDEEHHQFEKSLRESDEVSKADIRRQWDQEGVRS